MPRDEQFRLGTYGGVLEAALIYQRRTGAMTMAHWALLGSLVEFTVRHWREPDNGIWADRPERRHFTHSKVMAWVRRSRLQLRAMEIRGGPLER